MKKLYILLLGLTLALALPVRLEISNFGITAHENVAAAEACVQSQIDNNQQIKLGVPLLTGGDCVSNSAPGGAIVAYIKALLQFLSGGVGTVIVLMLVIAGIQYMTANGNPQLIGKAKDRITNAITALLLFVLGFAILSFIIPGGILTI